MIRTQIYLTEEEHKGLQLLSKQLGKKKSELIREALDNFLSKFSLVSRRNHLRNCKGMWKDVEDSIFSEIRNELNRE